MVHLMTALYYTTHIEPHIHSRLYSSDELIENIYFPSFLENPNLKTYGETYIQLIDNGTDIDFSSGEYRGIDGQRVSMQRLSSGCKVVLLVLWSLYRFEGKNKTVYLDITEAGNNALSYCLDILNCAPYIVGVLMAPVWPDCRKDKYEILMNENIRLSNWIGVDGICCKDAEEYRNGKQ